MSIADTRQATERLADQARRWGASLFGVADVDLLRGFPTRPASLLDPFRYAISMAVRLFDPVIDGISAADPTDLYAHLYLRANAALDDLAFRVATALQEEGYAALPLPASMYAGPREDARGHLSHRAVARAAGLGWYGHNLLLITPQHGPRVRLVTVLTNRPLVCGNPIGRRCGTCRQCIEACPVGALKEADFETYPTRREDVLDTARCLARLDEMDERLGLPVGVCGMCVKVCPWGLRGGAGEKGPR